MLGVKSISLLINFSLLISAALNAGVERNDNPRINDETITSYSTDYTYTEYQTVTVTSYDSISTSYDTETYTSSSTETMANSSYTSYVYTTYTSALTTIIDYETVFYTSAENTSYTTLPPTTYTVAESIYTTALTTYTGTPYSTETVSESTTVQFRPVFDSITYISTIPITTVVDYESSTYTSIETTVDLITQSYRSTTTTYIEKTIYFPVSELRVETETVTYRQYCNKRPKSSRRRYVSPVLHRAVGNGYGKKKKRYLKELNNFEKRFCSDVNHKIDSEKYKKCRKPHKSEDSLCVSPLVEIRSNIEATFRQNSHM